MERIFRGRLSRTGALVLLCIAGVVTAAIWASPPSPLQNNSKLTGGYKPASAAQNSFGFAVADTQNSSAGQGGAYSVQGPVADEPTNSVAQQPSAPTAVDPAIPETPAPVPPPIGQPYPIDPICKPVGLGSPHSCLIICPDSAGYNSCGGCGLIKGVQLMCVDNNSNLNPLSIY